MTKAFPRLLPSENSPVLSLGQSRGPPVYIGGSLSDKHTPQFPHHSTASGVTCASNGVAYAYTSALLQAKARPSHKAALDNGELHKECG